MGGTTILTDRFSHFAETPKFARSQTTRRRTGGVVCPLYLLDIGCLEGIYLRYSP